MKPFDQRKKQSIYVTPQAIDPIFTSTKCWPWHFAAGSSPQLRNASACEGSIGTLDPQRTHRNLEKHVRTHQPLAQDHAPILIAKVWV